MAGPTIAAMPCRQAIGPSPDSAPPSAPARDVQSRIAHRARWQWKAIGPIASERPLAGTETPNPDGPDCSCSTVEAGTGARPAQDRRAPAGTPGADRRRAQKPALAAPSDRDTAHHGDPI